MLSMQLVKYAHYIACRMLWDGYPFLDFSKRCRFVQQNVAILGLVLLQVYCSNFQSCSKSSEIGLMQIILETRVQL